MAVCVYLALELRRERAAHDASRLRYESVMEKRYEVLATSVEQTKAMVFALGELRDQVELLQKRIPRR